MSEKKKEEWAIRDEATGEWWGHQYPVTGLGWGSAITRYASYLDARNSPAWAASFLRETARIVPAPPREMSDAEALEWAGVEGLTLNSNGSGKWNAEYGYRGDTEITENLNTPFDVIRAARRKLEVGK